MHHSFGILPDDEHVGSCVTPYRRIQNITSDQMWCVGVVLGLDYTHGSV